MNTKLIGENSPTAPTARKKRAPTEAERAFLAAYQSVYRWKSSAADRKLFRQGYNAAMKAAERLDLLVTNDVWEADNAVDRR